MAFLRALGEEVGSSQSRTFQGIISSEKVRTSGPRAAQPGAIEDDVVTSSGVAKLFIASSVSRAKKKGELALKEDEAAAALS